MVARHQGQTRVIPAGGEEMRADALVTRGGRWRAAEADWQESRVRDPERLGRLLAVLTLALLAMASSGARLVKQGRRKDQTPVRRLAWSLVRLGMGRLTARPGQAGPPAWMPAPGSTGFTSTSVSAPSQQVSDSQPLRGGGE